MHEAIRANPVAKKAERKKPAEAKRWKAVKLTYEERKTNLKVRGPAHTYYPWHLCLVCRQSSMGRFPVENPMND